MKEFFEATAWTMEVPKAYGAFHLTFWLVGLAVCFLVGYLCRKYSAKTIKIILFIIGVVLLVTEVYKQLFYYYVVGNGNYQWWILPFQLCSVPMYLCIIQMFVGNKKVLNAIYTFMMSFSFFSGFVSFFEPSGLVHGYWTLTLHAFIWHLLLIMVGFILFFSRKEKLTIKNFFNGVIVYGIVIVIAEILNIVFRAQGVNMLYISPFVGNPIFIFKDIWPVIGWLPCAILYSACIMLGAFVIYLIFMAIKNAIIKRSEKKLKS